MLQKLFTVCLSVAVVATTMLFGGGDVFASGGATGAPVNVETLVDFSGLFTSLLALVGTVIAGAVGIGVSVWVVKYLWGVIKSTAR